MTPNSRNRGFTLIEMIAVTAIIGMMSTIIALRLDWAVPKYQIRSVGHRIAGLCSMARGYSVSRGRAFYVEYDLRRGIVTLLGPTAPEGLTPQPGDEFVPVPAVAPADQWEECGREDLPDGITFEDVWLGSKAVEGEVVRIEFSPLGTTDTHTVHLKDEGQRKFTVHVNGVTGSPVFHEERWDPPAPKQADEY